MKKTVQLFGVTILLGTVLSVSTIAQVVLMSPNSESFVWQDRPKPKELPKESDKRDKRQEDRQEDRKKDEKGKKKPDNFV